MGLGQCRGGEEGDRQISEDALSVVGVPGPVGEVFWGSCHLVGPLLLSSVSSGGLCGRACLWEQHEGVGCESA